MSQQKKQWGAIIIMIALFAMIAFVTNLCTPMATIIKNQGSVSNVLAQIGNYGNFIAYLVMGVPAGMLLKKVGYKKTALIALLVGIVGILIQWLSGKAESINVAFGVYLAGAFIAGLCMCMLNTVVNPMLNILGAKTTGASYVLAACPDSIYPLAATRFITPVFHPYNENNMQDVIIPMLKQVKAVSFGSGCTNFSKKAELLDLVLQNATCPVVLDAEALRLLEHNYYILQFVKVPVILTPHIGEFAALVNKPVSEIQKNRFACATDFAKTWNVYIVLKGPHTIVAAPDGKTYINQSGCQALATAGSGDVLTGILTGLIPLYKALFTAIISAVWLHGWIAEKGCETKSMQNFDLNSYPSIMDEQFFKHHF